MNENKLNTFDEKHPLLQIEQTNNIPENKIYKVYLENMHELETLQTGQRYTQVIAIIAFFCFLISLITQVLIDSKFSYMFLLVPSLASILLYTISLNMQIRIQTIFSLGKTSFLLYFITNTIAIAVILYIVGVCMKLDNLIETTYTLTATPIYIALALGFMFYLYSCPGMFKAKEFWLLCSIIIYLILGIIFFGYLNYRLDNVNDVDFTVVFRPLLLGLFVVIGRVCYKLVAYKGLIMVYLVELVCAVCLLVIVVMIPLIIDGKMKSDGSIPCVILFVTCIAYFADKVYKLLFNVQDYDEDYSEKMN